MNDTNLSLLSCLSFDQRVVSKNKVAIKMKIQNSYFYAVNCSNR